jgi:hypothetical protein
MKKLIAFLIICGLFVFLHDRDLLAQDVDQQKILLLEQRVTALEDYIQKLQASLSEFSRNLSDQTDRQMKAYTNQTVVLNPFSPKLSKIETNTGMFLISVSKIEKIQNGYRLTLNVGNTSSASFADVILRMRWGKRWDPSYVNPTYEEWRKSLKAGTFSYNGTLAPGAFNEVIVDLTPAEIDDKEYIECEMEAGSLKMQKE